jgi:hypothetical protein
MISGFANVNRRSGLPVNFEFELILPHVALASTFPFLLISLMNSRGR